MQKKQSGLKYPAEHALLALCIVGAILYLLAAGIVVGVRAFILKAFRSPMHPA